MTRSRRLKIALALNVVIVVGQVVAGFVAHSLGLLADAGHNLTDAGAVLLALIAVAWAARPPTANRSFGYHRATILAALANAGMILVVTVVIGYEAIRRFAESELVDAGIVVIVGLIAFAINAAAALVLRDGSDDLNMRAALLHMLGDAAASLGVVVAGLVILVTGGFEWLDPAVSLGIALLIAIQAWKLVRRSVDVLLESTPRDLDPEALRGAIAAVDGVETVHDLHVWSLSSEVRALSAHVVLDGHPTLEEAQVVGERVKHAIAVPFVIAHATLELECESCAQDASCIDASFALQTPAGMATATEPGAAGLNRRALRLEKLTIVWNSIEGVTAVTAGIMAGSIAPTGFGIDSAIETVSAVVVLHHLRAELGGRALNETQEQRGLRFISVTFFVLAAYVSVDSVITLIRGSRPETSLVGIIVTALSLVVMPILAHAKRRTGQALGNRLVIADARETRVCAPLSASTLGGLVAFAAFGWWWADPLTALVVAGFALTEGREAWSGELVCDD